MAEKTSGNFEKTEHYKFFQHRECEYFPCHKMENIDDFNCLFCYCPLYGLGKDCGGNFRLTKSGVKNCVNCNFPHHRDHYEKVLKKLKLLIERTKSKM